MQYDNEETIERLNQLVGHWSLVTLAYARIVANKTLDDLPLLELIEQEIIKAQALANRISANVYPGGYEITSGKYFRDYVVQVLKHANEVIENVE